MQGIQVFTLFGVPVFVSLWFVAMVGWWALDSGSLLFGIIWGVAVTFSILVHEFGHALVARHYGLAPQVVLHGWGGLCAHERAETDRHDALITAAGPAAGLALGGLVWLFDALVMPHVGPHLPPMGAFVLAVAIEDLLYINILWSLVNLLPLWPLDGGQLFRLGMVRWLGASRGELIAHRTGVAIGALAAAVGLATDSSPFIVIGGLFLAWMNYQTLSSGQASGPNRPRYDFARELLSEADTALAAGDWHEAARLGHQVRSLTSLNDELMRRTWVLLALASWRQGDPDEALNYATRAPDTDPIRLVRASALAELGQVERARVELAAIQRLPPEWQAEHAQLTERLEHPEVARTA